MHIRLSWPAFVLATMYATSTPGVAGAMQAYGDPTILWCADDNSPCYPAVQYSPYPKVDMIHCPNKATSCPTLRVFHEVERAIDTRKENFLSQVTGNVIEAFIDEYGAMGVIHDSLHKARQGIRKRDELVSQLMHETQTDLEILHWIVVVSPELSSKYPTVQKSVAQTMCDYYTHIEKLQADYLDVVALNEPMLNLHSRMDITRHHILEEIVYRSNLPMMDKIQNLREVWVTSENLQDLEHWSKEHAHQISLVQNMYEEYIKMENEALRSFGNQKAVACRPDGATHAADMPKEHSEDVTVRLVELTWEAGRLIRKVAMHELPTMATTSQH
jgi:hypothetical protein